jgi:hypothetical protein
MRLEVVEFAERAVQKEIYCYFFSDQGKSRSRASSTMCSPDKTELTKGGCGEV